MAKVTLVGKDAVQRKLLEIARRANSGEVDKLFYDALASTEQAAIRNAPTNAKIESMIRATNLFGSERSALWYLMKINQIKDGLHEIKDAIYRRSSRARSLSAFVATNYAKAHHVFWIEYGRFNFPAMPYFRPALSSTRSTVRRAIVDGLTKILVKK